MQVLIINQKEVDQLLPMDATIEAMAAALTRLAEGAAINPLRPVLWLPERVGALGLMPGYIGDDNGGSLGVKVISVFPGNHDTEFDSHQGAVLLFEAEHGRLLAIIDASQVTAVRTAAVSGVATRLLARPDAKVVTIMGSGVQARSHVRAMLAVRPVAEIRIWSRKEANARALADWAARFDRPVAVFADAAAAVHGADIICTTTAATEPILKGEWLTPGVHINAVGSSVPRARELDTAAMVRARLYADRRESVLNESGDFLIAHAEGAIDIDHIVAELGEVLIGAAPGRGSADEITLFDSLGLAVEDVAAARFIYEQALAAGAGTRVELGGERYDGS